MDTTTIIITSLITLVITVIAGIAVEYFKKVKPKLEYSIKESIPIELENKMVGANVIYVNNPSSRPVKDLTITIKATGSTIKNGGIKSTTGLGYELKEEGDAIKIVIPFLKSKDYISLTSIMESRYNVPKKPEVTIRSPDTYKLIYKKEESEKSFFLTLATHGVIGATMVGFVLSAAVIDFSSEERNDQSATLELAATLVGLPETAKLYTSSSGIHYYNQGPYAYSMAKSASTTDEKRKFKNFLIQTLQISNKMTTSSKTALCFFIGKISLLLNEKSGGCPEFCVNGFFNYRIGIRSSNIILNRLRAAFQFWRGIVHF